MVVDRGQIITPVSSLLSDVHGLPELLSDGSIILTPSQSVSFPASDWCSLTAVYKYNKELAHPTAQEFL